MIKYRIGHGGIESFEVLRETEKQVTVAYCRYDGKPGERREAKVTSWCSWHDTWADAHAALVKQSQDEVDTLQGQLDGANVRLVERKAMKQ